MRRVSANTEPLTSTGALLNSRRSLSTLAELILRVFEEEHC
jgi:hypothetical protein